jgi:hypothetical protein
MALLETSGLHQDAVLWRLKSLDARGQKRLSVPESMKVRWTEHEGVGVGGVGVEGGTNPIDATAVVDRDITIGSIMWQGRLEEWNPTLPQDLLEVVGRTSTPDVKGRQFYRTVTLRRYKSKLPLLA